MADISKQKFTNSTLGRPILVTATTSPGTDIHTVTTDTSQFEEVWLYAFNSDTSNRGITVEFGSNSASDQISAEIPFRSGLYLIIPGIPLQGNATPPTVKVYATAANVVSISGWINRLG
jgi:hypothetical protein